MSVIDTSLEDLGGRATAEHEMRGFEFGTARLNPVQTSDSKTAHQHAIGACDLIRLD